MTALFGQKMAAARRPYPIALEMQSGRRVGQPGGGGNAGQPVDALREVRGAEGAEADLQQGGMDGLRIRGVAIGGGVGGADREAVVDIAQPEAGLVDLFGFRIVTE